MSESDNIDLEYWVARNYNKDRKSLQNLKMLWEANLPTVSVNKSIHSFQVKVRSKANLPNKFFSLYSCPWFVFNFFSLFFYSGIKFVHKLSKIHTLLAIIWNT